MNNTDYSKLSPIDRIALYVESEACKLIPHERHKQIANLFRSLSLCGIAARTLLQIGSVKECVNAARSFKVNSQSIKDIDVREERIAEFINHMFFIVLNLPISKRLDLVKGLWSIFQENAIIMREVADMTADQGNLSEAERIIREAIEHNPNSINCYLFLVYILSKQGKKREAYDICLQKMDINKYETFFYEDGINLALELKNYEGVRRFAEAILSYKDSSLERKYPSPEVPEMNLLSHEDEAWAYLALGFLEKISHSELAVSYLEQSVVFAEKDNDRSLYERLEETSEKLGWENASQLFRERKILIPEETEPDDDKDIKTTTTSYLTGFPSNYLDRYVTTGFLPSLRLSLLNDDNEYFVSEKDKEALDFLIAPTFRISFAYMLSKIGLIDEAKEEISDLIPLRESLNFVDGNCLNFVTGDDSDNGYCPYS
jgi:tetratricopeptide (TPR) repeat protein